MLNGPVKIDPEFKAVCPPLTKEERGELRESIKRDGCREDILTWRGFVIDGHNRLEICEELHKPYTTRPIVELKSRGEVIEWILRNQLGRRNLTAMQRAELALKLKDAVAAEAKARQVKAGKEHGRGQEKVRENSHEPNERTDEKLAEMAGVSSNTIRRVEKIVAEAEPEVVEAARKGEMSINAAYKTVAPTPKPQEPAEEPQDGFALAADNDEPEGEERATEPPSAVSVEAAPEPVKRIKNWQRFKERHEAELAHAREKIIFGCGWGQIEWLYMDYIPGEPRVDYLRRLDKHGILKSEGFKELKRLEKAEKKGATK